MFLYNITLNPTTAINQAIYGNFSGTKQQEIIVARQTRLELLRPDASSGKVHTVLSHECFGLIRSLAPFRLTGGSKGKKKACCTHLRNILTNWNRLRCCWFRFRTYCYS